MLTDTRGAGQRCGGPDNSPPHPSPLGAQDLHCQHVQQPGRRVSRPQPAFKTPATVTAVETVWSGPGCVFLGHPRSPRSTVLRGQLHFLLPRSGGHCSQPCLSELMLPTTNPSVRPTHQAGHRGLPQGTVSQHWHFPGQLWALGPRSGAGQRVGDALESTVEGRTVSPSCRDMGSREEKGLGWLLRGQGVGRKERGNGV